MRLSFQTKPRYVGVDDDRNKVNDQHFLCYRYKNNTVMFLASFANLIYLFFIGNQRRLTARILHRADCKSIYSFVLIPEEKFVKENNGFLLLVQFGEVSLGTS